jgi:hypothetical protein
MGGKVIMVGMPHSGAMSSYEPVMLAATGQGMVGSKMGDVVIQRDIPWMVDLYMQGRLKLDELISGRWSLDQINEAICRRQFFRKGAATGLGAAALMSLLGNSTNADAPAGVSVGPHFAPKAKRAIYLSLIGAPSQFETFDYKPKLEEIHKQDLKEMLVKSGQRLTTMTSGQAEFPAVMSKFKFEQHGENRAWVSELLPYTAKMVDDICIIRSMHTDAINHEPANQLMFTGNMVSGKPSIGSWLSYGLGAMNRDLPEFVVLHASNTGRLDPQAISSRFWGAGFLPGKYAGVSLRSHGDPVLFLKDSPGIDRNLRKVMLDNLNQMNQRSFEQVGDPETQTRMKQYEMAFRMQASVPDLTDLSDERKSTWDMYGPDSRKPGTFARSCLMARRSIERDVRFVQIFHRGWDQHKTLPEHISKQCKDIDQAQWALIQDLKQRGLLEDTLVICGGEFGRTAYSQGKSPTKPTVVITIQDVFLCGWPEVESNPVFMARLMKSHSTLSPTQFTCAISTPQS